MLPVHYNFNLNRLSLNSSSLVSRLSPLASRLAHGRTHERKPIHDSQIKIAVGLDSIGSGSRSLPLSGLDYRSALGLSLSHLVACEVRYIPSILSRNLLAVVLVVEPMYIEFYDAMSVPMAIALSSHLLLGQPVMVKPSEAEKNLVQSSASTGGAGGIAGPYGAVDRKLYEGNLHFNMTELQLKQAIQEVFVSHEFINKEDLVEFNAASYELNKSESHQEKNDSIHVLKLMMRICWPHQ
ncbi:hypothetical protein Ccrd_021233 [Cynara cardunculus var. scolymus]|uniref:Uncharacterized protein n=1 Tax=Cynara cardunculus var. scolymus TaxID=59895 RepID=A0A103Y0Z0_CYNCS|nr:hypothetical protein Ccrd_021233 [Cynara cardunculus var. scolymus]